MKRILNGLIPIIALLFHLDARAQLSIDVTTGKDNITGLQIADCVPDDDWRCVRYNGTPVNQNAYSSDGLRYNIATQSNNVVWTTYSCGKWITSNLVTTVGPSYGNPSACPESSAGFYEYEMNFTNNSGIATSATLNLSRAGADNSIVLLINGNSYNISTALATAGTGSGVNSYPTLWPYTVTINPAHILCGQNTIIARIRNWSNTGSGAQSPQGFMLCGTLDINTQPPLVPNVTGYHANLQYCEGEALTFNGSTSTGPITSNFWEIAQCDASGNVNGPYWSHHYVGFPSVMNFSAQNLGFPIVCGNYYKVKLAVYNSCIPWVETNVIIYVNCNPIVNLGSDLSICSGNCTTLSVAQMQSNTTYTWMPGHMPDGWQATVCPTSTTTYTVTATNTVTGCSASDQVNVNVEDTDPYFTLSPPVNIGNYFNLTGTPAVQNVSNIPGFGFGWWVEEVQGPNYTQVPGSYVQNSPCWWSSLITDFNGYNGPAFTAGGSIMTGCTYPDPGQFSVGHCYRITRGTWSDNCPWRQYSVVVCTAYPRTGDPTLTVLENVNAPDMRHLIKPGPANQPESLFTVSPNPSNGLFSIETSEVKDGMLHVYDALGNKIYSLDVKAGQSKYDFDLSGYAKGIYFINLVSTNGNQSMKIIVE